ncbi:MAG: DNA-directed RNA polymerase subunit omega [Bacillota bacterium]|nr:DNA-directed RNA polymerase subunit omega [Bacillota bacterium]
MKKPTLADLLKNDMNRYALVTAIAKRAREIQEQAERTGTHLSEKPVILATDDIYCGRVKVIEK